MASSTVPYRSGSAAAVPHTANVALNLIPQAGAALLVPDACIQDFPMMVIGRKWIKDTIIHKIHVGWFTFMSCSPCGVHHAGHAFHSLSSDNKVNCKAAGTGSVPVLACCWLSHGCDMLCTRSLQLSCQARSGCERYQYHLLSMLQLAVQTEEGLRVGRQCVVPMLLAGIMPFVGQGALTAMLHGLCADSADGACWALMHAQASPGIPL